MNNEIIANIFYDVAKMLEIKGDNPFRVRAYQRAARNIESLGQDLTLLAKQDQLTTIPGIGQDLADKIKEIILTGTLATYEKLQKEIPQGVFAMLKVSGLGPKTIKTLYSDHKIDSITKLEEAAKRGELTQIKGIREKTQENILRGIDLLKKGQERIPYYDAYNISQLFIQALQDIPEIKKLELSGSLRRKQDTIGDIDILAVSDKPEIVMDKFVHLPLVDKIIAQGETKSSVIAKERNIQVDLRLVKDSQFGAALVYFTGSQGFNIKIRHIAVKKNYKVNEYGVFAIKKTKAGEEKETLIASKTEEEVFSSLAMDYIEPELRQDRGEVEAALNKSLPKLVTLNDIKGDLHVHSNYSDGVFSLEELARFTQEFGYQYMAVCDHSVSLKVAKGLSKEALKRKRQELDEVNNKFKNIKLLFATEVDINSDGSLDYPDSILKEFDLVMASIHIGFKQSKEHMTKRIISACKNQYVDIIGHLSGRLLGERAPYELDMDEVIKACRDYSVALEINANPLRLDLIDIYVLQAKKQGVKLSLGTDTHRPGQFEFMPLGIDVARRGWLEAEDIINCLNLDQLLGWLKR